MNYPFKLKSSDTPFSLHSVSLPSLMFVSILSFWCNFALSLLNTHKHNLKHTHLAYV